MRYFDHNATHPLSAAARAAWLDAIERFPANPSSPHRWGSRAAHALEEARARVARWIGARAEDVVWTSGATESNNSLLQHLGAATSGPVLVSSLEHPSVQAAARRWLARRVEEIPAVPAGLVEVDWIVQRLGRGGVAAVVLMAANNETGVLQPWREVREACARSGVPFVCDAAQWLGKLPADDLGTGTLLSACGHKFGGPPGVGMLTAPPAFQPLLVGGPQEEGRRAGTENLPGILAFVAALEERVAALGIPAERERRETERARFVAALKATLPGVEILGDGVPCLWNTVAALMPAATDCRRRWVVKLDKLGFAVSTGSACASGKEKPSPVLAAMGRRPDESDRMLRFSAGWETTPDDWQALLDGVRRAAAELGAPPGSADPAPGKPTTETRRARRSEEGRKERGTQS